MSVRALSFLLFVGCAAAPAPCPPTPCPNHVVVAKPAEVPMTPEAILERIFSSPQVNPDWFQERFLKAVPASKIDEITQQVLKVAGPFRSVKKEEGENKFEVSFERGSYDATIILESNKVSTLFIKPRASTAKTLEEAVAPLRTLPGKVSFTVRTPTATLIEQNATTPLAVGSAFKLAVLAELRNRIEKEHKLTWDQVIKLDPKHRSLPSGQLQDWPANTPMTVQSVASLMISISDNTATDMLIHLLGRAKLGTPINTPFLMTSDLFRLKAKGNEALLARYRAADAPSREKMLDTEVAKLALPDASAYPVTVNALDVEWLFTPNELCDLMSKVRDLGLMSINPGVAKKTDWDRVSYKGGSEPGVISMTTWVEKGAKSYCVSAIWNDDKPVEDVRFSLGYASVLAFLSNSLP